MTLASLAAAVSSKRISAREIVSLSLDRIDRLDGAINCVTVTRPDAALEEAAELDERVARGDSVGPLAGLPLLVKDIEDAAGLTTTYGSVLFASDPPAKENGLTARRLSGAGAIVVGKTNQPEFAFAGYTTNALFGTTGNPWRLDRSPGGSSGGSGAAIAAGLAAIATASDGGGSIRTPASFCGLAGLKPTNGVVPRDPAPDWIDLNTFGPLGTSVADLTLLLSLQAGPVAGDPAALPSSLPEHFQRPRRAFAIPRFEDLGPLPDDVATLFDEAVARAERDLGLTIERIEAGSIFDGSTGDDWFSLCGAEQINRLGRHWVIDHMDEFSVDFQRTARKALTISLDDYLAARRRRFDHVRALDRLLGDDTVLLAPTNCFDGWSAEGRRSDGELPGMEGFNTGETNLTGHPSLSLPAGFYENGIPFGLQIVAPRFADLMLLELGEAWEASNPWPLAADGYDPFEFGE